MNDREDPGQDPVESLADGLLAFEAAREANLRAFRALSPVEWERSGVLEGVGAVTLRELPVLVGRHDQAHAAEIAAWIRFSRGAGDA